VLFLIPIGLLYWIMRTRTTVDADTVTVRGLVRSRRVAWTDITALRLRTRSRVSAVLADGTELPLPAVHVRDLPLLSAMSDGRLPDLSKVVPG
jgi:Bacterial PH domain